MIRARNLGAMLALGALTALPACSSDNGSSQYSAATPPSTYAAPPISYGTPAPATGTSGTMAPVSPAMIRQVQTTLAQSGDYRGQVDGVWGPMSEHGVRTWQQAHNLNPSGEIDVATLQSMNIPGGSQANSQPEQSNQNNAAATQPTGNQNYSTGTNNSNGSNYSSTNNQMPAGAPPPPNQGTTGSNANNGATNGTAPKPNQ